MSVIMVCFLITMLTVPVVSADASYHEDIGDGLEVDIRPIRLTLANGDKGVFEVKVTNTNDVTYYVKVIFSRLKSIGASGAEAEPSYQAIGPGSTGTFRVTVTSYAMRGEGGDTSDIRLAIVWSTVDDPDMDENGSAVGGWDYQYDIVDDFSEQTTWMVIILVFVVLGILALILVFRMRSRREASRAHESAGEKD